jgi:plasmid stability protein
MAAICHHLLTMPALVIKPFPAALHTKLRRIAAEHRRSVTQETIHLLEMAISAADRSNPAAADGQPKWAKRSQCDSLATPALRLSKPSWERQKWGRPKTARRKTARRKTQDARLQDARPKTREELQRARSASSSALLLRLVSSSLVSFLA